MGVLAACSPELDWRSVEVPGTGLVAQLPCRPARFEREIAVAGTPLKLFMLSCAVGGATYGVATADVGDATRVQPVLAAFAASARGAIRAVEGPFVPFDIPGATPFPGSASARLHGIRPDGRATDESIRLFARGTRIFQLTAIGSPLSEAEIRTFEDDVRFDLAKTEADPS